MRKSRLKSFNCIIWRNWGYSHREVPWVIHHVALNPTCDPGSDYLSLLSQLCPCHIQTKWTSDQIYVSSDIKVTPFLLLDTVYVLYVASVNALHLVQWLLILFFNWFSFKLNDSSCFDQAFSCNNAWKNNVILELQCWQLSLTKKANP